MAVKIGGAFSGTKAAASRQLGGSIAEARLTSERSMVKPATASLPLPSVTSTSIVIGPVTRRHPAGERAVLRIEDHPARQRGTIGLLCRDRSDATGERRLDCAHRDFDLDVRVAVDQGLRRHADEDGRAAAVGAGGRIDAAKAVAASPTAGKRGWQLNGRCRHNDIGHKIGSATQIGRRRRTDPARRRWRRLRGLANACER